MTNSNELLTAWQELNDQASRTQVLLGTVTGYIKDIDRSAQAAMTAIQDGSMTLPAAMRTITRIATLKDLYAEVVPLLESRSIPESLAPERFQAYQNGIALVGYITAERGRSLDVYMRPEDARIAALLTTIWDAIGSDVRSALDTLDTAIAAHTAYKKNPTPEHAAALEAAVDAADRAFARP